MSLAVTVALFAVIFFIVLRRVDTMEIGVTQIRVWVQFAILACGAFGSVYALVLSPEWAAVPMMGAVLVFLMLGGQRWRGRAPDGVSKRSDIDDLLAHVAASIRGNKK